MPVEIWIASLQHDVQNDGTARRLTSDEVHQRALASRPEWLACELDRRSDEARIADVLASHPDLNAAFAPHPLDAHRIGIVVDQALLSRLSAALAPQPKPAITGPHRETAQ